MAGKDIIPFVASVTPSPRTRDFMEEYFTKALKEKVRSMTMVPRASPWSTPRSKGPTSARGQSADHCLWSFGPKLLVVISLTQEDIHHGGPTGGAI